MQSDIANPTASRRLPVLPLRDVVVFPHMVIPLFVGREKFGCGAGPAMGATSEILLVAQPRPDIDEPGAEDIYDDRHDGNDAAAAEAARRHGQGAGRGHQARAAARSAGVGLVRRPSHRGSGGAATAQRGSRDRSDRRAPSCRASSSTSSSTRRFRPKCLTSLSGIDDRRPPGRHDRRAPAAEARREAARARDRRRRRAAGAVLGAARRRDRHAAGREAHPRPRQAADGEEPARVLPQRADEGDPEGTRREARKRRTSWRSSSKKITAAGMPKEAEKKATRELKKLKLMSPMSAEATVVRNYIDSLRRRAVEEDDQGPPGPAATPRKCSTPTTTASRRSRSASSNTSRCSSAWTR